MNGGDWLPSLLHPIEKGDEMATAERRVFLAQDDVPDGTKVLGIRVNIVGVILVVDDRGEENALPIPTVVFVELTPEEWEFAHGNQQRIDDLGYQFGRLMQQVLSADWHHWHS
jgi:flavin reductase (DIM6/NTAB) family NADH-FMN oxidoreductase RutF